MNQKITSSWITFTFALLSLSTVSIAWGDEDPQPVAPAETRKCEFSGKERFTFHVDGTIMGLFEKFTPPAVGDPKPTALFENGIIIRGSFIEPWVAYNAGNPKIRELHDIAVFDVSADLDVGKQLYELTESDIVSKDWATSTNRATCLIVKSAKLSVTKVIKLDGRPSPSHP